MARLPTLSHLYDTYLRKAPRQSRSRSVVEAILLAALEHLARADETSDLSIDRVAQRAGVGIGSLYDYFRDRDSLLAAAAAKVTADNLAAFEALLGRTASMSLRHSVEAVVDFTFATYDTQSSLPRMVLRIAYAHGLMPSLAASQAAFARTLADALRRRTDVHVHDLDATAWVLTSAILGVVHALVWTDEPPASRETLRATVVEVCLGHLAAT
jgi:AcrR family transcriptional regulator